MSGTRKSENELDAPPIATADKGAVEVLRVWAAPGQSQQLTLRTTWKNPGAWGLLLADVANHAANAYASEGQDREEVLARIVAMFRAELDRPTDEQHDITPK